MKRKSRWIVLVSMICVISLVLSACQGNGNESKNNEKASKDSQSKLAKVQELNMVSDGDISTMASFRATDGVSLRAIEEVKSGLMRLDKDGNIIPDMAKEMPKVSDDQKVYTFKLRPDAKWSNGDPVTADDFVYAWHKILNKDTAGEYAYIFTSAAVKNAKEITDPKSALYNQVDKLGIKALDEKTVQVTLERPTPFFLSLLAFPPFFPVDQKVVKKYGDKYAIEPDNMVYNGPFTMTEWHHGTGWTFKKNPDYWDAKDIHLNKVNYKIIKEVSTQTKLYDTDKIDFTTLSTDLIRKYENKSDLHKGELGKGNVYLSLNQKIPALKNKDIRNAIYNGFDRKKITEYLLKDGSAPAYYFVAKGRMKGPDGKDFRAAYPEINKHDLKWAQAKWRKGLHEIGKNKVNLQLLIYEGSSNAAVAQSLKFQLEKNLKGIHIEIRTQPVKQFSDLMSAGNYDFSLTSWGPDYPDPMSDLEMWVTGGPFNNTGFSSEKYDSMIQKAKKLGAEPKKRYEVLQKAEKLLLDSAIIVPVYQPAYVYLMKPYVKQFVYTRPGPNQDWTYAYIAKH
ncbi:oligopeptide transport system substrate-binding protein [Scopulibacillus darangshiensis]|uniref:Oligopeptide transport system substrate-binding protein n=1 Tax=Scopulibacillus darangshiensis TaxID=442528 RepID=A0A4V2SNH6_9BACL|nr:peptide ABC transporter substrate-binding protein [Scopulibacillus darangshiensis]TCP31136.1 oligopeptide transport system substrate-binding protein [Scopulibacillus darangshiensis]